MDSNLPRLRSYSPHFDKSASVAELMSALAKASMEFGAIERDREEEIVVKGKIRKRRFASDHALLAAVKPALLKHGIVVMTTYGLPDTAGNVPQSTALWCGDEWISTTISIAQRTHVREFNGEMTQYRKYALAHLLGVAPDEDDDGASLSEQPDSSQAEPTSDSPVSASVRAQQRELAARALMAAKTAAKVEDILQKVNIKVAAGEMDAAAIPSLQEVADRQLQALADCEVVA